MNDLINFAHNEFGYAMPEVDHETNQFQHGQKEEEQLKKQTYLIP